MVLFPAHGIGVKSRRSRNFSSFSVLYIVWLLLASLQGFYSQAQAQDLDSTNVKRVVLYDGDLTGHSQRSLWDPIRTIGVWYGGFESIRAQNPAELDTVDLDSVQILIIYSDGNVLPDSAQRIRVEDFVQGQGKGLILMHASADNTDWNFLRESAVQWRYSTNGVGQDATVYSDTAGLNNDATRKILERLPERWQSRNNEEWYTFSETPRLTPGVTVLLSIDESTYTPAEPAMGDDHPIAWTRIMGNGITVYNSMGHSGISLFETDNALHLLWGMMRYAAKDFVGCMDSNYVEYNPEATVDSLTPSDTANPCQTPKDVSIGRQTPFIGLDVTTKAASSLVIELHRPVSYHVMVVNFQGKTAFKAEIRGPETVIVPGLKPGIHIVRIRSDGGTVTRRVFVR